MRAIKVEDTVYLASEVTAIVVRQAVPITDPGLYETILVFRDHSQLELIRCVPKHFANDVQLQACMALGIEVGYLVSPVDWPHPRKDPREHPTPKEEE